MKSSLSILTFFLVFAQLNAQKIKLPTYRVGEFNSDTIFKAISSMGDTGEGSATFQNKLTDTLLNDVKFYVVIDSVDNGGAPSGVTTAYVTGANATGGGCCKGNEMSATC